MVGDSPEQRREEALAVAPTGTLLPDKRYRVLLDGPDKLPLAVLDWLTEQVMLIARSLASDRHHRGDEGRYPSARVRSSAFPPVGELRFAVPPARRIAIYEELIGRLEASLREGRGRNGHIKAHIAYLEGLLRETQQQTATGGLNPSMLLQYGAALAREGACGMRAGARIRALLTGAPRNTADRKGHTEAVTDQAGLRVLKPSTAKPP